MGIFLGRGVREAVGCREDYSRLAGDFQSHAQDAGAWVRIVGRIAHTPTSRRQSGLRVAGANPVFT